MAGLPGTGLGGVFYALLVIWMAVRESWLLSRSASCPKRWIKIGWFLSLLAGILLVLWFESWLLQQMLGPMPNLLRLDAKFAAQNFAINALVPALAIAPFAILAAMIIMLRLARLLLPLPRKTSVL